MTYTVLDGPAQWAEMRRVQTDPRPRIKTGFLQMDALLYRESLGPGTFALLAGRMHTRKTAVVINFIASMLRQDVPVLFVSLDEAPHMYTAKLASVLLQIPHTDEVALALHEQAYKQATQKFAMTSAHRPGLDDLTGMLDDAEVQLQERPRAVVIDYLSLLKRGQYDGKDQTRIPRLAEDLQAWSNKEGVVTIALHQVGRQGDDQRRVHGDRPITPEQLMYGGEQQADIIFGTYRPELDPLGNMTAEQAVAEGNDPADHAEAVNRVTKYARDTFLQLIKNRPGIYLEPRGVRLKSIGDTQEMIEYP